MIRVLIVDDQVVFTQGLRVILNAALTIKVVGTAYEGSQAVEMTGKLTPDLVLIDLKLPGMNGIHATPDIREQYPGTYVLVLTNGSSTLYGPGRPATCSKIHLGKKLSRPSKGPWKARCISTRPLPYADDLSATACRAGQFHRR